MALTKVTEVTLQALVSVASNTVNVGTAVDVSTYYAADVRVRMGRGTGTAFTTGPEFRIEVAYIASPTVNDWVIAASFQSLVGATIGSQAVSGAAAAGATAVTLAAATNFASGDYLFFHNTTLANSEFGRGYVLNTATFTMEEGLKNTQTGSTVRNQSEYYHALIDLTSIQRMRLVVNARATGQACIAEAGMGAVSGL